MTRFGTAGIRGPVGETVTPELALAVGQAVADDADVVAVGRDARPTGAALADAVAAGLQSGGAAVRRLGKVPTPALAYASQGRHGVMVTASHNPPADNGIKLFADGVEYDSAAEQRIETRLEGKPAPADWRNWQGSDAEAVLADYRSAVADFARRHGADPDDLPVAVDCGNGTAGVATPQVLADLGAAVHAINADLEGVFPARDTRPSAESLADLRAYVAGGPCVLGFGHDGDGDRVVVLDRHGEVVHAHTVLAVLAHHYVAMSDAAKPFVVTTQNVSGRVDDRVAVAGGRVERVPLGAIHEGIASVQTDGQTVAFAAEPWKHCHPALGGWLDAVASVALLTRLVAADGLETLVAPIDERPARRVSLDCPAEQKTAAMDALADSLPARFPDARVEDLDGLRLDFPDGDWVLVRPSGTEPTLRLYAESDDLEALLDEVRDLARAAIDA